MDIVRTNVKVKIFIFLLINFAIIVISGLRWRTGTDWGPYLTYYESFDPSMKFFWISFEPGYTILTYFCRIIMNWPYNAFLFIFSFLTIILRAKFIRQHTKYIFFAMLIFWGNSMAEMFPIRQSLAISICLLTIPYIERKKFLPHLIITIIGIQFHSTAIIWIVAYFVYNAKWSLNYQMVFLLLAICVGLAGFLDVLFKVLSSSSLFGRLSEKATVYSEMGADTTFGANKTLMIGAGLLKRAIIFPVLFYFEKVLKKRDEIYPKFMNLFVFGNVLYFLVIDFLAIQRIATYFYAIEVLIICKILESIKDRRAKFIWFLIFTLYALVKLFFVLSASKDFIVPYYWINSASFHRPWI